MKYINFGKKNREGTVIEQPVLARLPITAYH